MYLSDKPKSALNAMNKCGVSNVFFFPLFVVRLGQFKKKNTSTDSVFHMKLWNSKVTQMVPFRTVTLV